MEHPEHSKACKRAAEGMCLPLYMHVVIFVTTGSSLEDAKLAEYEDRLAEKQAELARLITQRNELMATQKKLLRLQEQSLQVGHSVLGANIVSVLHVFPSETFSMHRVYLLCTYTCTFETKFFSINRVMVQVVPLLVKGNFSEINIGNPFSQSLISISLPKENFTKLCFAQLQTIHCIFAYELHCCDIRSHFCRSKQDINSLLKSSHISKYYFLAINSCTCSYNLHIKFKNWGEG